MMINFLATFRVSITSQAFLLLIPALCLNVHAASGPGDPVPGFFAGDHRLRFADGRGIAGPGTIDGFIPERTGSVLAYGTFNFPAWDWRLIAGLTRLDVLGNVETNFHIVNTNSMAIGAVPLRHIVQ